MPIEIGIPTNGQGPVCTYGIPLGICPSFPRTHGCGYFRMLDIGQNKRHGQLYSIGQDGRRHEQRDAIHRQNLIMGRRCLEDLGPQIYASSPEFESAKGTSQTIPPYQTKDATHFVTKPSRKRSISTILEKSMTTFSWT
jgi:hypothetical protein